MLQFRDAAVNERYTGITRLYSYSTMASLIGKVVYVYWKKNPSIDCAKAEEGLQTTDFRLPTSANFWKKKFWSLKSEVWRMKSEVWSLKSSPAFVQLSVGCSIYWYFFKPRYNLASKANILSLKVVNLPCQRLSLDPGPIFSHQDHIYFKAAMTDKIELGNNLIDCLIQVRLCSSIW